MGPPFSLRLISVCFFEDRAEMFNADILETILEGRIKKM